jgi:hypothetical protein
MKKSGKADSIKFNTSDWLVVSTLGVLCVVGLVFGLFKLAEFEQQVLDSQTSVATSDGDAHGSQVLDLFVNRKSALVLVIPECDENTDCSDYIAEFFVDLLGMKKSAPQVVVFDIVAARERGDTNLDVVLGKLSLNELPALVLLESGVETSRKEGMRNDNNELNSWLINNGIVNDTENFGN